MSKEILDLLKGIQTDVNGIKEATAKVDELTKKLDGIDTRTSLMESAIKKSLDSNFGKDNAIPKKTWSWARFAFAKATKDWSIAPFEKEECDKHMDYLQKTMQAQSFSAGGSLIPPQFVNELIDMLHPTLITSALGVRIMTGLTGSPVVIPKLSTGASAYWISEGNAPTASDQSTGSLIMQPRKVGALVKLSNDLISLSSTAVEAGVRMDMIRTLQEEIDKQFFRGTGVSGIPVGLETLYPNEAVDYLTTDAGTIYKSFTDFIKKLEEVNAVTPNFKWAMTPSSYWTLAGIVDVSKRALLQAQASATLGAPPIQTLIGYPIVRSTLVSSIGAGTSHIVWGGNWDDTILAIWNQIEVVGSTETSTAFQNDELWIRAIARVDYGVRRAASIACIFDVE